MRDVTRNLIEQGVHRLGFRFDPAACEALLAKIKATRCFGPELFLSEEEFQADPQFTGVNPRPGRNLYEDLESDTVFVEQHPKLRAILAGLLGPGYVSLHHKVVCGVPESWIPEWLRARILGNAVNNLGGYVRPEYRDMTYFYGIDYHQDIIDWKGRDTDFTTLYVYLHDVTESDAPLHLLPKSHRLGATTFPHKLERLTDSPATWRYASDDGRSIDCQESKLLGPAGTAAMWHAAMLHGTRPDTADDVRLSLRLLYARDPAAERCGMDEVNETLQGNLALAETREDLAEDGSAAKRINWINSGRQTS